MDWPSPISAFDELTLDVWLSFNSHSAYNTYAALTNVNDSDSVTATDIGLLSSNNPWLHSTP